MKNILSFISIAATLLILPATANSTCDSNSKPHIASVSFNYEDSDDKLFLQGVAMDEVRNKEINKKLFKTSNITKVSDGFFKKTSSSPSPKEIKKLKHKFLLNLKKLARANKSQDRIFQYSGHGIKCKNKEEKDTWCLILPAKGFADLYENDSPAHVDYLVTAEEIMENYRPSKMILDACFSGDALISKRDEIGGKKGLFLMSSSLSGQFASDGNGDGSLGGKLVNTLYNFATADQKNICDVDVNNDGKVSERELSLSVLSSMVHSTGKESLDSNELLQMANGQKNTEGATEDYETPDLQLLTSKASDKCVYKIPTTAKCSDINIDKKKKNKSHSCSEIAKSNHDRLNNINELFTNPKKTEFLRNFNTSSTKNRGLKRKTTINKNACEHNRGLKRKDSNCKPNFAEPCQTNRGLKRKDPKCKQIVQSSCNRGLKRAGSNCSNKVKEEVIDKVEKEKKELLLSAHQLRSSLSFLTKWHKQIASSEDLVCKDNKVIYGCSKLTQSDPRALNLLKDVMLMLGVE